MPKPSQFQIFRIDDSGPRWITVRDTVEEAKSTVLALDRGWGIRFFISNEATGDRIVFDGHYFLADKSGRS